MAHPTSDFLSFYDKHCRADVEILITAFTKALAEREAMLAPVAAVAHMDDGLVQEAIPAELGWHRQLRDSEVEDEERHAATTTDEMRQSLNQLEAMQSGIVAISTAISTQQNAVLTENQFFCLGGMTQVAYNACRISAITRDGQIDDTQPPKFYSDELKETLARLPDIATKLMTTLRNSPEYKTFQSLLVRGSQQTPPTHAPPQHGPQPVQ